MMASKKHNYLFLIWRDPESRKNFIIGKLSRCNRFTFEYCEQYKEAQDAGWNFLEAFPEEKVYESDTLFAVFSGRLPDPKRRDISQILKKYELQDYDGFELLRKSTGRLPIDTYEFIDPIFPEEETIQRDFYIMGIRHYCGRVTDNCDGLTLVKLHDLLELVPEPENTYDPHAVKVVTSNEEMVGYIPRYYSEGISARINKGMTYSCEVIEIHEDNGCENCIKVRLKIPKEENKA